MLHKKYQSELIFNKVDGSNYIEFDARDASYLHGYVMKRLSLYNGQCRSVVINDCEDSVPRFLCGRELATWFKGVTVWHWYVYDEGQWLSLAVGDFEKYFVLRG